MKRLILAAAAVSVAVGSIVAGTAGASASKPATVKAATSQYGKIVWAGNGRALYSFSADRKNRSNCYGSCAKAWPPLLTKGKPRGLKGVNSKLLGTTRRKDGSRQVTYKGHPLYFYEGERAGQVKCQGVNNAGGLWLVVSPAGKPIR